MHELVEAMAGMEEQEALQIVDDLLSKGEDPAHILDLSSEAMQVVGERYQEGTYFLPELIMAGEMLRKNREVLKPRLAAQQGAGTRWIAVTSPTAVHLGISAAWPARCADPAITGYREQ